MRIFTAYCCRPRDWQPSWAKPMSPQATRRRLRNCEQRLMPIFLTPAPGLYNVNTGQPGVADQQGNAYAVLYGVAPAPRTNLVALLQNLTTALYRTPTAPNATGPVPVQQSSGSTQVGPYTSAYELFARFETGDTADALALIRNEWGLMRRSSPYYSGATWEYVGLDGTPGLREGTSLAHGWGSGPTSALSKYVLGIRPVPVFCPSRSHIPAFLCSTGITPFLRSYEGSVTFRVRFFGPSAGHECRSFPEWRSLIHVAPTSCHSITTHPMHSFSCAHCLAAGRGRRSCLAPLRVGVRFWASLTLRKLAIASGRIVFIIALFMDWQFISGCLPPRLSTTQFPSTTDSQCSVRWGLPPHGWCALSGA